MKPVAEALQSSRLFAHLEPAALVGILEASLQISGEQGTPINARPGDVVIVIDGGLQLVSGDNGATVVDAGQDANDLAVVQVIPRGSKLTMTGKAQVLVMDGAVLDQALSQQHQTESVGSLEGEIGARVSSLIHTAPFDQMTLDHICQAAEAMQEVQAQSGEEIVRYAERGDKFYVVNSGEAEVWRTDLRSGASQKVATLGPGASFGEEALLGGGLRNATVRMSKAGKLYYLTLEDFNRLLASHFIQEIDPDAAQALLRNNESDLLDCRYGDEHAVWRIPGSTLMPLDKIREQANALSKDRHILIYCRTGRRSRVAAFLLRQLGFNCSVIRGGISQWPYQYEGDPVHQAVGVPPI